MALTYKQAKLVRDSVPVLREHGERISSIFYATMLDEHPDLRDYFNTTNQQSGRQPRALTAIILAFASNISHTSELVPRLERVCHKHCSLNIRPQQYAIVGEYLIRAFREVLGSAMTPELQSAWTDAYCVLARMMMGRESHLYRSFDSWQGWRRMRVDRKVAETSNVCSFYLVPITSAPSPPSTTSSPSSSISAAPNSLAPPKPLPARPSTSSHRSNSIASDQSRPGRTGRLRARLTGRSIPSNSSSHVSLASTTTSTVSSTISTISSRSHASSAPTHSSHTSALPVAPPPSAASATPAALPHFLPGQYVSVRLPLPPAARLPGMTFQTRQYSLSDRWSPDYYRISVKRDVGTRFANAVSVSYSEPGLVSNALIDHLEVGDTIDVSHPTGEFFLTTLDDSSSGRKSSAHSSSAANSNVPLVLISAGIGAAPMMAMLSTVAISQSRRAITYVHGCHCSPPVFDAQIRELQRQLPRLRTAFFFSDPPSSDVASDTASSITPPSSHADSMYAWKPRSIAPSIGPSIGPGDAPDHRPTSAGRASIQPSTTPSYTIQPPAYEFSGRIDLSRLVPGVSDTYPLSSSDGTETPPTPTNIDDEDLLHLGNNSTEYFVCGPEAFMLDMAVCLVHGFGVNRSRIRYELFSTGDMETEQQDSRMSYIR